VTAPESRAIRTATLASRALLTLIAAAMLAILFLSDRPVGLTDMVRIDELAVLPGERLGQVRAYTEVGSGLIPYFPGEAVAPRADPPQLKLGWVYREFSALRMPFFARSEVGPVTFIELPAGRQFAILGPEQAAQIDEMVGRPVAQGQGFAWYEHLWGWLIVLGLLAWTLLRRREARIREDEHWAS
jgi:hypothetical protein